MKNELLKTLKIYINNIAKFGIAEKDPEIILNIVESYGWKNPVDMEADSQDYLDTLKEK